MRHPSQAKRLSTGGSSQSGLCNANQTRTSMTCTGYSASRMTPAHQPHERRVRECKPTVCLSSVREMRCMRGVSACFNVSLGYSTTFGSRRSEVGLSSCFRPLKCAPALCFHWHPCSIRDRVSKCARHCTSPLRCQTSGRDDSTRSCSPKVGPSRSSHPATWGAFDAISLYRY